MKKTKKTSHKNRYWLFGLALVCILLMVLSTFADKVRGPFKVMANVTVIPMQQGINHIGGWLGDMNDNFKTLKEVQAENKKLKEQVNALITENNNLQEDKYELERLQALYKLDQNYAEYEKVGAHVIGKDSGNWFSTFTIDKGSNDGIAVDMNVIADGGLVGIVTSVGPSYSTVMSIIDDSSNVSAMVLSTSDICYIRGDLQLMNDGLLHLEKLNKDVEVENGAKIVTSHVSSKYLQGILIGYVTEITTDSNNLTKSGYISPVVDFEHLQNVLVITELKQTQDNKE